MCHSSSSTDTSTPSYEHKTVTWNCGCFSVFGAVAWIGKQTLFGVRFIILCSLLNTSVLSTSVARCQTACLGLKKKQVLLLTLMSFDNQSWTPFFSNGCILLQIFLKIAALFCNGFGPNVARTVFVQLYIPSPYLSQTEAVIDVVYYHWSQIVQKLNQTKQWRDRKFSVGIFSYPANILIIKDLGRHQERYQSLGEEFRAGLNWTYKAIPAHRGMLWNWPES